MNKGLRMAKGEILGWLNADHTYNPGTISRAVGQFLAYPEIVMIYGDAYFVDKEGRIIGHYPTEPFHLQRLSEICFICQPSVFPRTEVFQQMGTLDIHLHTCMDYDYWIRIGKHYDSKRISYLQGEFLANSRVYSDIKTFRMRERIYAEIMETVKKHFGYVTWTWIYGYFNDVVLPRVLKRYGRLGVFIKPMLPIYLTPQLLRNWRGYRYLFKYLGNNVKSLKESIGSFANNKTQSGGV